MKKRGLSLLSIQINSFEDQVEEITQETKFHVKLRRKHMRVHIHKPNTILEKFINFRDKVSYEILERKKQVDFLVTYKRNKTEMDEFLICNNEN